VPQQLFIHGFFTIDGQKMSKSLGNVVNPVEVSGEYGLDVLRYYLFREITFGQDGDFSLQRLAERYNSELVNGLGNLVARILSMAEKYSKGKVPAQNSDKEVEEYFGKAHKKYAQSFEDLGLHKAAEVINDTVTFLDGYIQKHKPWQLVKDDPKKVEEVLYNLLESLRHLAWFCLPLLPETADKIFVQLGLDAAQEKKKDFNKAVSWKGLKKGGIIKREDVLFPRR